MPIIVTPSWIVTDVMGPDIIFNTAAFNSVNGVEWNSAANTLTWDLRTSR